MVPFAHSHPTLRDVAATASFLAEPPHQAHSVQFYEEPDSLFENVARFLSAGLEAGDRVLVIATAIHEGRITQRLGAQVLSRAIARGHIVLLDAHQTLEKVMVGETVDADRFHELIGRVIGDLRGDGPDVRVRAFGEMVDVLWKASSWNAALRLEELWDEACRQHDFSVMCAYALGPDAADAGAARFAEVCERHSHVIRSDDRADVANEASTRRNGETLEQRIRALETELHHRKGLELALRHALRDRSRIEAELRESVHREREARTKAEENDAFKEQFLAILGHDLRNPLNTILTTSRLMIMRRELAPESTKRIDRVIVSGVRMQRMIEQILDVTSDRLDDGIRITRDPDVDVAALASSVLDELRASHPGCKVDVVVDGPCIASIDTGRIEQVLRNLLGNAFVHGDPEKAVRLKILASPQVVSIEVHNFGPVIEDAERALLFEPFKRSRKAKGRSDGLGLGLYISRRIVNAHGGTLDMRSAPDEGTTFRVTLPRDLQ